MLWLGLKADFFLLELGEEFPLGGFLGMGEVSYLDSLALALPLPEFVGLPWGCLEEEREVEDLVCFTAVPLRAPSFRFFVEEEVVAALAAGLLLFLFCREFDLLEEEDLLVVFSLFCRD